MTRSRPRMLAALVLSLPLLGMPTGLAVAQGGSSEAATASPRTAPDTAAQGAALVERFLTILREEDAAKRSALEAFLAPEFQLLRADGTRLTRDEYLANPSTTLEWQVHDLMVTGSEGVLVASYLLEVTVTIDDVTRTATAPRLSVFHESGGEGEWRLAAHANFMPLDPGLQPSPQA